MHELLVKMAEWLLATIGAWGYPGIVILMCIESSVIPLPSEIVMPPAGVHIADGNMEWIPVILAGTFGSWLGATLNYLFSLYVGRPFLDRYGKYFFVRAKELEKCDHFFRKHGEIATFIGRLLPGFRHLISIPAGLSRMNYWKFSFYTCTGAGIWVTILTYAGYLMGKNRDRIEAFMGQAFWYLLIFVALIVLVYIFLPKLKVFFKAQKFTY